MTTVELYYSDTCHTCHQIRALLIENLPGNIKFKEINISYPEGKSRASQLNIMSVPTVAIDGDVVFIGRVSKEELMKEIELRK
ncbi:MAG: thioredoxin family protein [Candidatus Methanoperedens sp.]|nr:thioredoxin family protein [Candidatus Methanoperedens sp.]